VSLLNPEKLVQIQACFMDLQPQVKLKLLLSFFHIGRRNLEAWKGQLNAIISVAMEDSEPWVCMLADLMKTLPETGQLNSDIQVPESNKEIFHDLLTDLKKGLEKNAEKQRLVLPLECHYLNKNAFLEVVGPPPQNVKHFTLRRKPKAAALKAELSNKSVEAAKARSKQTSTGGGFPVRAKTMPRKMDMPMKGLSSRPGGMFRRPGAGPGGPISLSRPNATAGGPQRKESGVKMMDINELPLGFAAMKKRRKQEMEDAKKAAAEEAARVAAEKKKEKEKKDAAAAATAASTVQPPDYAAGLNAPATPAAVGPGSTPAYAPPTPTPIQTTPAYAPAPTTNVAGNLQPPPPSLSGSVAPNPLGQPGTTPLAAASSPSIGNHHQPQSLIAVMQQQPQNLTSTSLSTVSNSRPTAATALLVQQQPLLSQAAKQQQQLTTVTSLHQPAAQQQQQQPQQLGTTVIKTSAAASATPFLGGLGPLPQSAVQVQSRPQVIRQQQQQQQPQLPTQPLPQSVQQQTQLHQQLQPGARIVQLPTEPIPQSRVVQMQTRAPGQQAVIIGGQAAGGATTRQILPQNLIATTANTASPARIIRPAQQPQQTRMVVPAGSLQPTPAAAMQPQTAAAAAQPSPAQQPRRQLTLTMQQKMEAQEMFRTANRVTRPEKALILGFMAGSRENPCPGLGNVVTIKLSENRENMLQTDQTYLPMIVETHFQMNYMTGEWNRIEKYRRIENAAT